MRKVNSSGKDGSGKPAPPIYKANWRGEDLQRTA